MNLRTDDTSRLGRTQGGITHEASMCCGHDPDVAVTGGLRGSRPLIPTKRAREHHGNPRWSRKIPITIRNEGNEWAWINWGNQSSTQLIDGVCGQPGVYPRLTIRSLFLPAWRAPPSLPESSRRRGVQLSSDKQHVVSSRRKNCTDHGCRFTDSSPSSSLRTLAMLIPLFIYNAYAGCTARDVRVNIHLLTRCLTSTLCRTGQCCGTCAGGRR